MYQIAILIQLAIFVGIIVFAVKLVRRLGEIAEAQKSAAQSQAKLVEILITQNKRSDEL